MVKVGELCSRQVVMIGRDATVVEAARLMREHHVGSLVVTEERSGEHAPVGIVTDRDLVVGVLATADPYLTRLEIGDLLAAPVVTAREDESLTDAIERMRTHGIRRMPVVDDEGLLVGLLAFDDVLELLAEQLSSLASLISREQRKERVERSR
jgi:CBS domain-containing protein